jgi:hypothetical protein
MNTKQIIRIAEAKGIAIAKRKPGVYQYWSNGQCPTDFVGSWSEFAKFIQSK